MEGEAAKNDEDVKISDDELADDLREAMEGERAAQNENEGASLVPEHEEEAEPVVEEDMELEEAPVQAEPEMPLLPPETVELVDMPKPQSEGAVNFLHVPEALLHIEHKPFSQERFEQTMKHLADVSKPTPSEVLQYDTPWRVVRWRYNANGDIESNAKLVTWSDGSQHLFVGKDMVYEVKKESNRKETRTSDLFDFEEGAHGGALFATLDERLKVTIALERFKRPPRRDTKRRGTKRAADMDKKVEDAINAEYEKEVKRKHSELKRQRQKQREEAATRDFTSNFLEEDEYGALPMRRHEMDVEEDDYGGDDGFINDEEEEDGGAPMDIDERRILEAKRPRRREENEEKDELQLWEEGGGAGDDVVVDEDQGGGMVLASDESD